MNERELQNIWESKIRSWEEIGSWKEGFSEGILYQDPISREVERDKIKQELIERIYKLEYAVFYNREELLEVIKAVLP